MSFLVPPRLTDLSDDRERFAMAQFMQLAAQVAANISFLNRDGAITDGSKAGNLDAVWVVYTSNATPSTEDTVPHTLGRTPIGLIPGVPDKAGRWFASSTFTADDLFLTADVASLTVNLIVF